MHGSENINTVFAQNRYVSIYVVFCCLVFTVLGIVAGEPNWDMLGYVASIWSFYYESPELLHAAVYESARAALSTADFAEISGKNEYRRVMAKDPELFYLQIPYYQIRVLFLTLIAGLEKAGMDIFFAGRLISSAAGALGAYVLYLSFRKNISPIFWILFPAVYILAGVLDTAFQYTPDTMAFLVFALVTYAFLQDKSYLGLILVFSVFVRTDLIVLVAIYCAYAFLFLPGKRVQTVAVFILTAICYLSINSAVGNYGWSAVHYFVFESDMRATDPREFADYTVTVGNYFSAIFKHLPTMVIYPPLWFYLLASLSWLILFLDLETRFRQQSEHESTSPIEKLLTWLEKDKAIALLAISSVYIVAHFVLFPLLETRFFIGPYMIAALCFLSLLSHCRLLLAKSIAS